MLYDESEFLLTRLQRRLGHLAISGIFQQGQNVIHRTVWSMHTTHRDVGVNNSSVLSNKALLESIFVDLTGKKPVKLRFIGSKVLWMRQVCPSPLRQFFGRITKHLV